MIICESSFDDEDPRNPGYSLEEVDFYSHVPLNLKTTFNHRLSLRKNLKTSEYELIQVGVDAHLHATPGSYFESFQDGKGVQIAAKSTDLSVVLAEANRLEARYWGPDEAFQDEVCKHSPRRHATCCKLWQDRWEKERSER